MRGKVVIDFEYSNDNKCSWDIKQIGEENIDKETLVHLLQHIAGELVFEG